jgi:hypothetical protein
MRGKLHFFLASQNLLTLPNFLHMGTCTTEKGANDLNRTCLLSCLHSKKNVYDKQPSHLPNLMRSVYRFYSSVDSSAGSSDNGPRIPSELRVKPL